MVTLTRFRFGKSFTSKLIAEGQINAVGFGQRHDGEKYTPHVSFSICANEGEDDTASFTFDVRGSVEEMEQLGKRLIEQAQKARKEFTHAIL